MAARIEKQNAAVRKTVPARPWGVPADIGMASLHPIASETASELRPNQPLDFWYVRGVTP